MASDTAYSAVRTFFAANWTATTVSYENEKFTPPRIDAATPAWVRFEMTGDLYEQASFGADAQAQNLWRETGAVVITVVVPAETGTVTGRTYARQIAQLFKGLTSISGMWFGAATISSEPDAEDGNWWHVTVAIEFTRDET